MDASGGRDRLVVDPNIACRLCRYCHVSRPCENPQTRPMPRTRWTSSSAGICQVLMYPPHRHRALPHRRGDPLDRATSHVAREVVEYLYLAFEDDHKLV